MADRLQKILARAGYGSRRSCEDLIRAGRVTVNGEVAVLGSKAEPGGDDIRLDGRRIQDAEALTYIIFHKPTGVLSSLHTQGGHPTVLDYVSSDQRLFPVGRLDLDSEGLILLTNDGELANRLTHPRYGHEKEYRVLLNRVPDAEILKRWRQGVRLPDGYKTSAARIWKERGSGAEAWVRVILREGHKRQIRETARVLGFEVRRLIRVRVDGLMLDDLAPGEWRPLSSEELRRLLPTGTEQNVADAMSK